MGKSAVVERVRHVGEVVGPKAREVREAIAPKVMEARDAVAPKARELGDAIKPRVKQARRKVGFWIAGEEPRKASKWPAFAAAGVGAAVAFFLDPVSGKRRRSVTKDWVGARVRGTGTRTARMARGVRARATGLRERMAHTDEQNPPENDATLAHKVKSELFQGVVIPAGEININAENGVVVLRGALRRPKDIIELEKRAWDIQGVRGVHNLLHLEGTPAPTG
jgi:hypothetical protein